MSFVNVLLNFKASAICIPYDASFLKCEPAIVILRTVFILLKIQSDKVLIDLFSLRPSPNPKASSSLKSQFAILEMPETKSNLVQG